MFDCFALDLIRFASCNTFEWMRPGKFIGEIATKVAGADKVENQLEVKATPPGK